MTIRYTNTRWDLLKARIILQLTNKFLIGLYVVLGMLVAYSAFAGKELEGKGAALKAIIVCVHLLVYYGICSALVAGFTVVQLFSQKNQGLLGEHTLRITDEGLEESTPYNVSLNLWSTFNGCKQRAGICLIYVTENTAHFVPLDRPLLEGNLEAFLAAIRAKTENSAHTRGEPPLLGNP